MEDVRRYKEKSLLSQRNLSIHKVLKMLKELVGTFLVGLWFASYFCL